MPRVVDYFGQSLKAALSRRINMVTFANLGSVRLPSLKFVGLRVRKIRRIQCITCLSTTVSQLFEPQLKKKSSFLRTPAFIFCLPWGRPCDNHAKRCMNEKTIQCLPNPSQHVPIYLQQFPSYSNASAKNRRFHVTQPTFLFSLETPLRKSRNMLHGWKDNSCLPNHFSMYLSIFNSFQVIRCLSQCVSPKIDIFTTFLFPLGMPLRQSS